jgi:hypothetical protein
MAFEVVHEWNSYGKMKPLTAIAFVLDKDGRRRMSKEEFVRFICEVNDGRQVTVEPESEVRWAIVTAYDVVNRNVLPSVIDVIVQLMQVSLRGCRICGAPLFLLNGVMDGVYRRAYICPNSSCKRIHVVESDGTLRLVSSAHSV